MEVLLDSSFIISCIRKRIDFIEELQKMGFNPTVPKEVIQEMKDLKDKKGVSREVKTAIDVAFEIIEKKKIKKNTIGSGKVDKELIKYGQRGMFIATLDKEIKRSVPNRIFIEDSRNSLAVQRD